MTDNTIIKKDNEKGIIRKGVKKEFDLNIANIANSILNETNNNFIVLSGVKCGAGTSSIALAVSETLSDYKKVLLIEANFISPSYSYCNIGESGKYFDDFLLGTADISQALVKVKGNLDALLINGNGKELTKSRMLLTNGSLSDRFRAVTDSYDVILVDAPSVECADDAVNLAKIGKQIALVLDARTPRKALKKAVNKIDCAKVELLGIILNKKHKRNLYN